jgi:O-antigen/teichoic acid export membrane protein
MSKETSLGRLTFLYTLGNITSKVLSFALFFIYTFYLSKEEIGNIDIIVTTASLLIPIITLQIYDATFRFSINQDIEDTIYLKKILSNSFIILIISSLIFSVLYFISDIFIDYNYLLLIYLLILFQSFNTFLQPITRGLGESVIFVLSGIIYSFVFVISSGICIAVLNYGIEGVLISNILAYFISTIVILFRLNLFRFFSISQFNYKQCLQLLQFSFPLIPNTLSWWAIASVNRYVIYYFMGPGPNGLMAIALKLPSILLMVTGIFGMAWTEKAIQTYNSDNRDKYYSEILKKYIIILYSTIMIMIAVSKPFIRFFVEKSYFEVWHYLPILYLAVGFQSLSSFYGTGYISSKNTKGAFTTTLYGTITTIISSIILVPLMGLLGASISFLLGYFAMFAARLFNTSSYFNITFPFKTYLLLLIVICISILLSITDNGFIQILNVIFSISVGVFLNRDTIFSISNKIRRKQN